MAYTELVSFIREQLQQGRDAKTIRDYLLRREISPEAVDAAFDEVFDAEQGHEVHTDATKFVAVGLVVLMLVFIGVGIGMYYKIAGIAEPSVELPVVDTIPPLSGGQEFKEVGICDFVDEEKYECYFSKFDKDEVQCHEIDDLDEQAFCYRAQDVYVIGA